jgi:hypothetical protein
MTLAKHRSGTRVWDINSDGVAHYGLYPDWIEDIRKVAGRDGATLMCEMGQGAEAYLQMWERAGGVKAVRCPIYTDDFRSTSFGTRIRRGDSPAELLERVGQPTGRSATGWQWCARRDRQSEPQQRGVGAAFGGAGTVALVLSAMPATEAAGIGPGDPVRRVRADARSLGGGLWVRRSGSDGARFVYVVRDGIVRSVGVGTEAVTDEAEVLARYVTRAGVR